MGLMENLRVTLLGEFGFDGRVWTVEVHAGAEIWVTHDSNPAAKMLLGASDTLGPPVPIGQQASWDWLAQLRVHVVGVIDAAGRRGEGPWAGRYTHA